MQNTKISKFLKLSFFFISLLTTKLMQLQKELEIVSLNTSWANKNLLWSNFNPTKAKLLVKPFLDSESTKLKKLEDFIFFKKKTGAFKYRSNYKLNLIRYAFLKRSEYVERFSNLTPEINALRRTKNKNLNEYLLFNKKLENINQYKVESFPWERKASINFKKKLLQILWGCSAFIRDLFFRKNFRVYKYKKFIHRFKHKNPVSIFFNWELMLMNVIVKLGFLSSISDMKLFLKYNIIFINGKVPRHINQQLKKGDIIQLILGQTVLKAIQNARLFFFWKKKRLSFKMWKIRKYKNIFFKERTKHIPRFVTHLKFFCGKTPRYLELDYVTLTAFIILKPNKFSDISFFFQKFFSSYMLRLYNWKRIV